MDLTDTHRDDPTDTLDAPWRLAGEAARALLDAGQMEEGAAAFEACLVTATDPAQRDHLLALYVEGLYKRREGFDAARALVARMLRLDSKPVLALKLAGRHAKLLFGAERAACWDAVLSASPLDGEALQERLAVAIVTRDRAGIAAVTAALRAAAAAAPDFPLVGWSRLGDALLIEQQPDAAFAAFDMVRRANPLEAAPLVGMAAALLDRGDRAGAAKHLAEATYLQDAATARAQALLVGHAAATWSTPPPRPAHPAEACEIFLMTHLHSPEKLRENPHLGGPGTGLIAATLRSAREALQLRGQVPVTILYDHRPTEANEAYREALSVFAAAQGVQLVVNEAVGLPGQWLAMARRARSHNVMVIEHDHDFVRACPTLDQLLAVLDARPDIQHLKLPRRRVIVKGFDSILLQTPRDRADGLCAVPGFSNTPHILRRRYLDEVVVPVFTATDAFNGLNSGAAGVEEAINVAYRQAEQAFGLVPAMRLFGTYVWGQPESPRCVVHLGV